MEIDLKKYANFFDAHATVFDHVGLYPIHSHNTMIQMEIVFLGQSNHYLDGKYYCLSRGDAYIILPDERHGHFPIMDSNLGLYVISYNEELLDETLLNYLFSASGHVVVKFSEAEMKTVEFFCDKLIDAKTTNDQFKMCAIKSLLNSIVVIILRKYAQNTDIDESIDSKLVRNVLKCIEIHFRESDYSISEVGYELNKSCGYLGTLFKEKVGVSYSAYINKRRLVFAEKLLREGRKNIESISEMSGFNSVSYFIKKFRQMYGITPNLYMENYSKKYQK